MEYIDTEIGRRIQKMLDDAAISRAKLARDIGTTGASVTRYLDGDRKIPAAVIQRIANRLGTTTAYLLGDTNDPDAPDAEALPEFAAAVRNTMRELDAVQNYALYLTSQAFLAQRTRLRHIALLGLIEWIAEEYGVSEEGAQLAEALRRFESRIGRGTARGELVEQPVDPDG